MLGFVAAFLPWIVYWILVGNSTYLIAVAVAFGVAVVLQLVQLARHRRIGSLEYGGLAFFALSFVSAFVVDDAVIEQWLQPLSNGALFLIALVGVLIGRPFVRDAARDSVDAATAASDGFRYVTTAMTWMWVAVFALMTVSSLIPPLVDGAATIRDAAGTLSIVCYWVIPFALFGIAGTVSAVFPGWFDGATKRLDARQAALAGAGAGAGAGAEGGTALVVADSAAPTGPSDPDEHAELHTAVAIHAPAETLYTDPLPVTITGLVPGSRMTVRARTRDLLGRRWAASADYVVPESGILDLDTAVPVAGDWSGAGWPDAGGRALIGALRFAELDRVPELFLPPAEPLALTIEVGQDSLPALARRTIRRSPAPADPGVLVTEVDVDGRAGILALPVGAPPERGHPAVACFGGSEGGVDSLRLAASVLAGAGYAALVTAWTDTDERGGATISGIPLERFGAALAWLRGHAAVDARRTAALGISRGAEGLLAALAGGFAGADAVVALSPSSVRWQAVGEDGEEAGAGSWTGGGETLAWLPLRAGELVPQLVRNGWSLSRATAHAEPTLLRLRPAYAGGLRHAGAEARVAATIDATAIAAPVLFAGGSDDAVWPGAEMAAELASVRSRADDVLLTFPGAGHLLRFGVQPTDALWTGGIALGGTRSGHAAAETVLSAEVLRFLDRALGR
ncbi:acyl-CoA thioesterase/bile acid-CoA:amino acid N-acyltransferase family protein [Herbiconiux sp. 11R-BC]|uniref:acyl-CoA thioester hydrolase/BAAT C-terminal domain-containing protein n=1 Tax=Herbiconiux sp. 11R-BC TaxID=3111637 RepID=UPI003C0447DB